jgi:hypothetical protein
MTYNLCNDSIYIINKFLAIKSLFLSSEYKSNLIPIVYLILYYISNVNVLLNDNIIIFG